MAQGKQASGKQGKQGSGGAAGAARLVIGLMSGTSVDAVDAALLETDGAEHIRPLDFAERPYADAERTLIRSAAVRAREMPQPGPDPLIEAAARCLTLAHAEAVAALPGAGAATLIGFHGQTLAHRPPSACAGASGPPFTWQAGDAALLAQLTGLPVVHDFRSADVAAGGEGAPLAPGYHRALAAGLDGASGVLNLGGVGNLTWFEDPSDPNARWGAFDTGPGNAPIDDWAALHGAGRCDRDGALAAAGTVREDLVAAMADLGWFDRAGPKSLDRDDFSILPVRTLSPADGAATLTAFTAETVRLALAALPVRLDRLLVTGGGRHNPTLMAMIAARTGLATLPVEAVGWQGDALEAQAFGWLAVRHLAGLPLSWPETTGVPAPTPGGRLARP